MRSQQQHFFSVALLMLPLVESATIGRFNRVSSLERVAHAEASYSSQSAGKANCPITHPNGVRYTDEPAGGNHGNEALITALWPEGKVVFKPGGPGFQLEDGSLSMKWPWWRKVSSRLVIEGRRLDGTAPALRARIPNGYGTRGFQATALVFSTPGCWEVTGRVGEASLTFVTLVVKVGDGPNGVRSR